MNVQMVTVGQPQTFGATEAHKSALKDFIKMTIQDQSFFGKSRSAQKDIAMNMILSHKQ